MTEAKRAMRRRGRQTWAAEIAEMIAELDD
jgi:hypothetical protein